MTSTQLTGINKMTTRSKRYLKQRGKLTVKKLGNGAYCETGADGTKSYFLNGMLHRTDGPAVEYHNGTQNWYLNNELHRTDGPAVNHIDGSKFWYLNGKCHRLDGPAVEDISGERRWYINGKRYSEEDFELIKLMPWAL